MSIDSAVRQDLDKIHSASMEILSKTGIKLYSIEAVAYFAERGVKIDGLTVYPTEDFIMDTISTAPKTFTVFSRRPRPKAPKPDSFAQTAKPKDSQEQVPKPPLEPLPELDMIFDGRRSYFAPAYGCSTITEKNGQTRPSTLEDYVKIAKLVHQSPHFMVNGGILVQPTDVDPELAALAMTFASLIATDKCLLLVPTNGEIFIELMYLMALSCGGELEFAKYPRTFTLISTLSPLVIGQDAFDCLNVAASSGQALIIAPGPMAGASGPITLAGNLAVANAECLTAIALSQMVKPGTPVFYGVDATVSDLRVGLVSVGNPGFSAMTMYSKLMASYYGLPSRCGGAVTDALELSSQSGLESMMNLMVCLESGVDLIPHSAGVLASRATFGYEKFMSDLEMISMLDYAKKPLAVNDDTLALETIMDVGHEGVFFNQKHTLKNARDYPFYPRVAPLGQVRTRPLSERILANADKAMEKSLSTYQPPEMDKTVRNELRMLLVSRKVDTELTAKIMRLVSEGVKRDD
ncbi:MAG: trimethylamine methyltransferase family protein [Deltaproteobacteria bacterium]|jgi:trimethylamine--corrinoid protein Co-methyltransferase|nr:trimethylamine methyltransferase family protein [Deltaproteobacteria bacterium]